VIVEPRRQAPSGGGQAGAIAVTTGLGWPGTMEEPEVGGLGWPAVEPDSGARRPEHREVAAHSSDPAGKREGDPESGPESDPARDPEGSPAIGVASRRAGGAVPMADESNVRAEPTLSGTTYPQNPQVHPHDPRVGTDHLVSRETMEAAGVDQEVLDGDSGEAVSRETDQPRPVVSNEEKALTDPSIDPTSFGPYPPPGTTGVRTAADLAAAPWALADDSTPMALSVAHQLLVNEGRHLSEPLPRPAKPRIMVVANQKGGVGKTTSTVNIAAALAQHGLRVLVVDLDPQGNASTALSIDHHRGTPSTYDALVDDIPFEEIVQESPEVDGLFVVPATIDLAGAEIDLVSMVARESRLRKSIYAYPPVVSEGEERMDYVLIDCPPSLGLLTLNALVAGDEMLIPIQAEYYALEGLGQLLETVEMVKAHLNPVLKVSTILLTMYDARTRLSAGVADEVRGHFGDQVLRTAIPRSVRISEAPSYGQTVMTYDPGSPGALSYLEAAREMALKGVDE
jgi:chromosome partitioning protein